MKGGIKKRRLRPSWTLYSLGCLRGALAPIEQVEPLLNNLQQKREIGGEAPEGGRVGSKTTKNREGDGGNAIEK